MAAGWYTSQLWTAVGKGSVAGTGHSPQRRWMAQRLPKKTPGQPGLEVQPHQTTAGRCCPLVGNRLLSIWLVKLRLGFQSLPGDINPRLGSKHPLAEASGGIRPGTVLFQ